MSTNSIYYVYRYNREDGTPYYIGKGKGRRAYQKRRYIQRPTEDRIEIVAKGLSEHEAFILEKKLISYYGRKDLGTGILRNLTDGGEGVTGLIQHNLRGVPRTQEVRDKISAATKGLKWSEERRSKHVSPTLGMTRTKQSNEKTRASMLRYREEQFEARTPPWLKNLVFEYKYKYNQSYRAISDLLDISHSDILRILNRS